MSTDIHLITYFAIEAPLSTFYVDSGERKLICQKHPDHNINGTAKFCEHCGSPTATQAIMEPTEVFKAFCDGKKFSPDEAFGLLKEKQWEWSDSIGTKYTLGWYAIQTRDSSYAKDCVMALGVRLAKCAIYGGATVFDCIAEEETKQNIIAYSVANLVILTQALEEVKAELQIKATPKLYVQAYISC